MLVYYFCFFFKALPKDFLLSKQNKEYLKRKLNIQIPKYFTFNEKLNKFTIFEYYTTTTQKNSKMS